MKKLFPIAWLLVLASIRLGAVAAEIACPDLTRAVQVGVCPTEEQLKYTFTGYCSDDSKAYKGETDVCTDYQSYRKLKNIVLWESADGVFDAYLSCDVSQQLLQGAKVSSLKVFKQGKHTQLVCSYDAGVQFTHRTQAQCKPSGVGDCAVNPAACTAACD